MKKIGIVAVASYDEAQKLADALGLVVSAGNGSYSLYVNESENILLITPGRDAKYIANDGLPIGRPGKVSAAVVATLLFERYHADTIINAGTAAGIAGHDLVIGDIVVASHVSNHDINIPLEGYDQYAVRKIPISGMSTLDGLGLAYKRGVVSSSESFTVSPEQWQLMAVNDVAAQDMEAAGVVQAAQILGYQGPIYIVKAISGIANAASGVMNDEAASYEQNVSTTMHVLVTFVRELIKLQQGGED